MLTLQQVAEPSVGGHFSRLLQRSFQRLLPVGSSTPRPQECSQQSTAACGEGRFASDPAKKAIEPPRSS